MIGRADEGSAADLRGAGDCFPRRSPPAAYALGPQAASGSTLLFLLIIGLGPILWMLKSSVTPTLDTLRQPMALWPNGFDLSQFATAWNKVHIDRYLFNTVAIAFGSWLVQIVVATTAAFAPQSSGLASVAA